MPSNSALVAICQNILERLWVPPSTKLWECFKKNASLASFTKCESWLNALAWLGLSALFQGRVSCCLELGGPTGVTFEVVPPKGMLSMGSGEGCHLLGQGDCLGTDAGGAAGAGFSSIGEVLCDRTKGGDGGVWPNRMW